MHTKQSLQKDIENLGILPTDTIIIHSSKKSVGEVEGGAQTIIDAFVEYMKDGLLIFPTHTWMEIPRNKDTFDPLTEPSCVGYLTNLFLQQKESIRSLHPTHSVAAIGKYAKEYIEGDENAHTPCPRNGCWGKLYDYRAKILFLGCSLKKNTFIHSVEEWHKIPDRLNDKSIELKIIDPDTGNIITCTYRGHHCSSTNDISSNYDKLEKPMLCKKIAVEGKIGDAHSILCDAVLMADLVGEFLNKNPNLFINDDKIPNDWYKY